MLWWWHFVHNLCSFMYISTALPSNVPATVHTSQSAKRCSSRMDGVFFTMTSPKFHAGNLPTSSLSHHRLTFQQSSVSHGHCEPITNLFTDYCLIISTTRSFDLHFGKSMKVSYSIWLCCVYLMNLRSAYKWINFENLQLEITFKP